jgi:hypothetical protein
MVGRGTYSIRLRIGEQQESNTLELYLAIYIIIIKYVVLENYERTLPQTNFNSINNIYYFY